MKLLTLALLSALSLPALANAEIPTLAEGEVELMDVASPDEIAAELLNEGFAELDAAPTSGAARLYILVDKSQQRLWVYEDGVETGSWLVSTGTEQKKCAPTRCYVARTPVGQWTPKRMFYNYTSNLWNARMDRAIFFTGGIALHATYGDNIAKLGSKASGGCVRQSPENADKLYRLVKAYGMNNTLIRVQE
jgi:hypothetical protein